MSNNIIDISISATNITCIYRYPERRTKIQNLYINKETNTICGIYQQVYINPWSLDELIKVKGMTGMTGSFQVLLSGYMRWQSLYISYSRNHFFNCQRGNSNNTQTNGIVPSV